MNAKLGWQDEILLGVFLIASNIFNVEKPTASSPISTAATRGVLSDPRMFGLSFEGKF